MDQSRFDAWTRRRVGLAVGGLAAALVGLSPLEAKKKKRRRKRKKQRCLGFLQFCSPGGRACCGGNHCGTDASNSLACCKPLGATCVDPTECCKDGGTDCVDGRCAIV